MSRYTSRRSAKRYAAKSRRNFIITLVIVGVLFYSTINWILPSFIGGISVVKDTIKPSKKIVSPSQQNAALAPPVLSIPYEATNSSQIDIKGFGTADSKVAIYIDDELKQKTDVTSDGSFNFKEIALNLGTNNIYGKTIDDNDKESLPSKTIKLIYNNEKPPLDISEPEDDKKIQGGNKKVKVSGKTDPQIKVFINGNQVIVNKDGDFSVDQSLNDGDNIIIIKAVDISSNTTEIQRKVNYTP
ncbi:hypothetical protein M1437_02580 [Patescibacteria group bacterium]|nr:hypothetical protein [Patescibacteria group bacterium]